MTSGETHAKEPVIKIEECSGIASEPAGFTISLPAKIRLGNLVMRVHEESRGPGEPVVDEANRIRMEIHEAIEGAKEVRAHTWTEVAVQQLLYKLEGIITAVTPGQRPTGEGE